MKFAWLTLAFILASSFSGCVAKPTALQTELKRPDIIYVENFDYNKGFWRALGKKDDQSQYEFRVETAHALTKRILFRMEELAPAAELPAVIPSSGMLVRGEFIRGQRQQWPVRVGEELGFGEALVATRVFIYDLSISREKPVASFTTPCNSDEHQMLNLKDTAVQIRNVLYENLVNRSATPESAPIKKSAPQKVAPAKRPAAEPALGSQLPPK